MLQEDFDLLEMIKDKNYILELTDYKSDFQDKSYTLKFRKTKIFDGPTETADLEYVNPTKGGDAEITETIVNLLSVDLTFPLYNEK